MLWFAVFIPMLERKELQFVLATFCLTSLLSYEVLSHPETWEVPLHLRLIEYAPLYIGLLSVITLELLGPTPETKDEREFNSKQTITSRS